LSCFPWIYALKSCQANRFIQQCSSWGSHWEKVLKRFLMDAITWHRKHVVTQVCPGWRLGTIVGCFFLLKRTSSPFFNIAKNLVGSLSVGLSLVFKIFKSYSFDFCTFFKFKKPLGPVQKSDLASCTHYTLPKTKDLYKYEV